VLLRSAHASARLNKRFDVTRNLLTQRGWQTEPIDAQGESALAEMLWAIHLGDWVSYYVALLNGVDPMPVEAIDILKNALKP
jgi:glucose/mannose-6-phosphate isomerase